MSKLTMKELANFAIFFGSFRRGSEKFWVLVQESILNLLARGELDNESLPDIYEGIMAGDYKSE